MLAKMHKNRNSYSLLMGMQNDATTLEDNRAVSYKSKCSCNHAHWYLPKDIEILYPETQR
jgi:hypothetical protein